MTSAHSKEEALEKIRNLASALCQDNHSDGYQIIVARLFERCGEYINADKKLVSESLEMLKKMDQRFKNKK